MPSVTVSLSPQGAIINVYVAVSIHKATAMKGANLTIPTAVSVRALVDTGASCTCIDPSVITALGLTPTGSIPLHTPSTGGTPIIHNQYDVAIGIPGTATQVAHMLSFTVPVVEASLAAQGFELLLGMDLITQGTMILYGPTRSMTLYL